MDLKKKKKENHLIVRQKMFNLKRSLRINGFSLKK